MTDQMKKLELIRQANEILDRIDAALKLRWFEEEGNEPLFDEYKKEAA